MPVAGQPVVAEHGDVPEATAVEIADAETVVSPDEIVPACLLVGPHRAHAHLAQWDRAFAHVPTCRTNDPLLTSPPLSGCIAEPSAPTLKRSGTYPSRHNIAEKKWHSWPE